MFIPGVHSQPIQHGFHITGLISQQSQITYNMCETCTPAVPVTAPATPSAVSLISFMSREKSRGDKVTLYYPMNWMHTSSLITILQDILITVVRVLNHRQQRRRHASTPKVFPYCIPWNGVSIGLLRINESSVQPRCPIGLNCSCSMLLVPKNERGLQSVTAWI
jgi:hypothetical protein